LARGPPRAPLFPYTTLFRSSAIISRSSFPAGPTNGSPQRFSLAPGASPTITHRAGVRPTNGTGVLTQGADESSQRVQVRIWLRTDRKSTRLNSSHVKISYAV